MSIVIDPYHFYGTKKTSWLNQDKPRSIDRHLLSKMMLFERASPKTLVFGNSRFDVGLDPRSTSWPTSIKPVFNFAIPGKGIQDTIQLIDYALEQSNPDVLVWSVDFLDFLADDQSQPLGFPFDRSATSTASTYVSVSASLSALFDTLYTGMVQGRDLAKGIREDGFNETKTFKRITANEGYASLFRQKNMEYLRRLDSASRRSANVGETVSKQKQRIEHALERFSREKIDIMLVVYPYHADILEGVRLSGLQTTYEHWLTWLSNLATTLSSGDFQANISLWNFSGYSQYTMEPLSLGSREKTEMLWYWESGHFKPGLGEKMLERIFDRAPPESVPFGSTPITTPPQERRSVFDARSDYVARNPEEIRRIEDLFRQISSSP